MQNMLYYTQYLNIIIQNQIISEQPKRNHFINQQTAKTINLDNQIFFYVAITNTQVLILNIKKSLDIWSIVLVFVENRWHKVCLHTNKLHM